jgi:hypothetical protein
MKVVLEDNELFLEDEHILIRTEMVLECVRSRTGSREAVLNYWEDVVCSY